jgi:arylsulfatase A-like enzyme
LISFYIDVVAIGMTNTGLEHGKVEQSVIGRRGFLRWMGLVAVGSVVSRLGAASEEPASSKPNIIVILTDDQGWADVGAQGQVSDIRTPQLDGLAASGVRCTAGYITAPQCSPSRAGLLTGRYQQRFGLESIPDAPLPLEQVTVAERLGGAGYTCGMVGKWHLDPNPTSSKWIAENLPEAAGKPRRQVGILESARLAYSPAAQGFEEFFQGQMHRYWANYDLAGKDLRRHGEWVNDKRYRLDVQTEAALAFIQRNRSKPFLLYLAYFGPHTPLEATPQYLARFVSPMPERRRHALAMMAAIDDGVGRIVARLGEYGLEDRTLIFFTSDNGAPLKMTKPDSAVTTDPGGWDGSLNDPWVGEKGMLSEGGIRVPFVVSWPGKLPAGRTYSRPVSSLDIAATALAAAGMARTAQLDGVDLLPFLTSRKTEQPHEALYWLFWNQAAIRAGRWKYLCLGRSAEFLFDLESDAHERNNLSAEHPAKAVELRERLRAWCGEIRPPGLPDTSGNLQEGPWYRHYFGLKDTPITH